MKPRDQPRLLCSWSKTLCLYLLANAALAQDAAFQGNLKKNEDALAAGQQTPVDPLQSQIIKEAPVAVLTSGVGDVSIFGAHCCSQGSEVHQQRVHCHLTAKFMTHAQEIVDKRCKPFAQAFRQASRGFQSASLIRKPRRRRAMWQV